MVGTQKMARGCSDLHASSSAAGRSRIAHHFGQHSIARPRDRAQHRRQRVLRALRDQHARRARRTARPAKPCGARQAMPHRARLRRVLQQFGGKPLVVGNLMQRRGQRRRLSSGLRHVLTQIDQRRGLRHARPQHAMCRAGRHLPRTGLRHVGAVADARIRKPLAFQLGVRAADGAGGHMQFAGERAVRRQFFARRQLAVEDRLRKRSRNDLVFRITARFDPGQPRVHRHDATVSFLVALLCHGCH
jgi:hypothetical protein